MSDTAEAIVLAVFVLATSIWIGGYVAIAVVARAATTALDRSVRVAFFRSLGRSYVRVGFSALIIALVTAGVLVRDHRMDATLIAAIVVAGMLLLSLAVAVAQARRMTLLRRALLKSPADEELSERVRRGGRAAGGLRGVLGLLSLALVVLGAFIAT